MNTPQNDIRISRNARRGLSLAAALTLLGAAGYASAAPVTMAPPVDSGVSRGADGGTAADDSVFQWSEVPSDQDVPLTRAVFDQSGYQLYDTQGETILVPFTDNNLYVMKFAVSPDGSTYFVNTGDTPVLYLPKGGSLENAATPGARWYPFSEDFHPAQPVYVGVAPSWNAFVSIGWGPDVVIRGGYWGRRDFISGGIFTPSLGLVFETGGHSFRGWDPYRSYVVAHPDRYRFVAHSPSGRVFRGAGPGYGHDGYHDARPMPGDHGPRPFDRGEPGHRVFRGARGDFRHDHR